MENVKELEECLEMEIVDPYGFIYVTTNMVNGKKYIGQKIFNANWHNYLGSGTYFLRSVRKYGKNNFSREIIAIAYSKEELNELEIMYIANYNAVISHDYYNIGFGGNGGNNSYGYHHSNETKNKLSILNKGKNNSFYGRNHTEEAKIKNSEAHKGENNSHYGEHCLEKTKQKLSELYIRFNSEEIDEIRKTYLTGKYTQRELAKKYSTNPTTISRIVNYKYGYNPILKENEEIIIFDLSAKINTEQAIDIRKKYATGKYKQTDLAEEYRVSRSVIGSVVRFEGAYKFK